MSLASSYEKALEKLLNEDTVSLVKQLYDEVHNLRKAMDELAEMLNRLVLLTFPPKTVTL